MLEVHDLEVGLDSESVLVRAIDGLRLSMQRGETFALVGDSGCGNRQTAISAKASAASTTRRRISATAFMLEKIPTV